MYISQFLLNAFLADRHLAIKSIDSSEQNSIFASGIRMDTTGLLVELMMLSMSGILYWIYKWSKSRALTTNAQQIVLILTC